MYSSSFPRSRTCFTAHARYKTALTPRSGIKPAMHSRRDRVPKSSFVSLPLFSFSFFFPLVTKASTPAATVRFGPLPSPHVLNGNSICDDRCGEKRVGFGPRAPQIFVRGWFRFRSICFRRGWERGGQLNDRMNSTWNGVTRLRTRQRVDERRYVCRGCRYRRRRRRRRQDAASYLRGQDWLLRLSGCSA